MYIETNSSKIVPLTKAAELCGVTPQTFRNWRIRGYVLCVTLPNGRYAVTQAEIDRLTQNGGQR